MRINPEDDPALATGRRARVFQAVSRVAAVVPMLVGAAVLIGWKFDIAVLKSVLPGAVTMKANTAVGLILTGAALGLLGPARTRPRFRRLSQACAGGAVLLGLLTLAEYLSGWDLRIDQLLFAEPAGTVGTLSPGRMAPTTTLGFVLLGGAVILAGFRRLGFAAQLLTLLAGSIAALPVFGYLFGANSLIGLTSLTQMAVHTALAFIILSAGVLFAFPDAGLMAVATGGTRLKRTITGWVGPGWTEADGTEKRSFELGLLVITAALGAVITALGILHYKSKRLETEQRIFQGIEVIADLKAGQIASWRSERLDDTRFLMRAPFVARDVAALLAQPDSAAARADVAGWLNLMKGGDRYETVMLLDPFFKPLLTIPEGAPAPSLRLRAQLEAIRRHPESAMFDLHRADARSPIHVDLVAPIFTPGAFSGTSSSAAVPAPGAPSAYIVLRLDPEKFLFPLIQSWPTPSETAETLLVRREGEEVVYLNELRHRQGTALVLRRSVRDQQLPAAMGALGRFGVTEGVDYRGVKVLAATRAIPGSPWIMVAKVDQSEVYAPLREEAWQTGLVVAALLLSTAVCASFLWRHNTAEILHRALIAEKERKALTERLALVTRLANDIIFLMDAEGRILEANDRALSSYGYTLDELRRLPPGGLHSPEAMGNLARQLELFTLPDGGLFETLHKRKDGTVFPVEISGRAIEIEGREFKLSVVRDATERKRAEAKVNEQLDELRRWHEVTLGREDRVRELKREVNGLCRRMGEAPRYGGREAP